MKIKIVKMKDNIIADKTKKFALRIVKLYKYLCDEKKEFIMSKQILKSGTSIGANVKESECAQSRDDFYSKLNIALKEAAETEYWLELLYESEYIEQVHFDSIYDDCKEIIRILTAITKNQKYDE